jgi:hypothetical protein
MASLALLGGAECAAKRSHNFAMMLALNYRTMVTVIDTSLLKG